MPIRYLTYQQIDKVKWDARIEESPNGLIYACSFYLDTMSENWCALVLNDYEIVMPLTWKIKYGIQYLYQPFFTASLGVFGKDITATTLSAFLTAIPATFKYWDIYLNYGNYFQLTDFNLYQRTNYILPLNLPFETLYNNFRDNIKRNVKKANKLNCIINKNFPVDEVIKLAIEHSIQYSPITKDDYTRFKKLYQLFHSKKQAITYGVYTANNELLASAAFLFFKDRVYYILVGNHPNGKTLGASHTLITAFIKDHSGQNIILDFEGSNIASLAFFYSSFGAQEEKYVGLKINLLPWWIKIFKR